MATSRTMLAMVRERDWEAISRFAKESILEAFRNDADFVQSSDLNVSMQKVMIKSQIHGFVSSQIFDFWFQETFMRDLARRRTAFNYHAPAAILMEICTCHTSDRFRELCEWTVVIPLSLLPHSSNNCSHLIRYFSALRNDCLCGLTVWMA
jgi:hypothetical protein